jgi:hypothetical protein
LVVVDRVARARAVEAGGEFRIRQPGGLQGIVAGGSPWVVRLKVNRMDVIGLLLQMKEGMGLTSDKGKCMLWGLDGRR